MPAEQPTPADTLRQAAHLMRERANAATPGPWEVGTEVDGVYAGKRTVVRTPKTRLMTLDQTRPHDWKHGEANAEHIAAWHPAVALAVAGWLWAVAIDEEYEPETAPRIKERIAALAVARAYRGTTAQATA